jgi:hypothetical protein
MPAYTQAVLNADIFFCVDFPAHVMWRFTREDAERIRQPVLSVLGAERVNDWPRWPEVPPEFRSGYRKSSRSCCEAQTMRSRKWTPAGSPRPYPHSLPAIPFPRGPRRWCGDPDARDDDRHRRMMTHQTVGL